MLKNRRGYADGELGTGSGATYRKWLQAAPDATVVVNPAGEIVLLSFEAERQFGYPRDELVGQHVKSIIPRGIAERLCADGPRTAEVAWARPIGTGVELTGRRKDGSEFPIVLMLSPLAWGNGILVTAAVRDITRERAAEAQVLGLLQRVEELERSNEELAQFAHVASHDLQEPLRTVANYTQLLARRYKGRLDADGDEFIAFAVDGATRMQRLIQNLLASSRVKTTPAGRIVSSSEEALRRALLNLSVAIQESGARVTYDPLPAVKADDTQLTRVFQNLVGNAIKYRSPTIPRVHVSAARDHEAKWVFSVEDNGSGIDLQSFDRIFRVSRPIHERTEFAVSGMGLAICKKIVERHGGSLSVESRPGKGSTFRFTLATM
jgi:PAS domain S-box-containing protein